MRLRCIGLGKLLSTISSPSREHEKRGFTVSTDYQSIRTCGKRVSEVLACSESSMKITTTQEIQIYNPECSTGTDI